MGISARVFALTFVGTLLSFAVSLLVSIGVVLLVSAVRSVHPDFRIAYRYIALPIAVIAAAILAVLATTSEIRHYRQAQTLKAIERMS